MKSTLFIFALAILFAIAVAIITNVDVVSASSSSPLKHSLKTKKQQQKEEFARRLKYRNLHRMFPTPRDTSSISSDEPGTANCTELFFTQPIDHFSFSDPKKPLNINGINYPSTFKQRYYMCGQETWNGRNIFYYTGNEASVDLFVNQTGLMWDNRIRFQALLIFAEHRYFGKSLPFPGESMPSADKLRYLNVVQALEDHANLAEYLRVNVSTADPDDVRIITFGGSYGAELSTWARSKYPAQFDGAIAGSSVVAGYEYMRPKFDANSFADVETQDATPKYGAAEHCSDNIRQLWKDMLTLAKVGSTGFELLSSAFQLCNPISSMDDVLNLRSYMSNPISYMAMGSYSWRSGYMLLGGAGKLPPYPVRVLCKQMSQNVSSLTPGQRIESFMKGMVAAYFNASGSYKCVNMNEQINNSTEITGYLWNRLACGAVGAFPSSTNGKTDMFWNAPFDKESMDEYCEETYGTKPDWHFAQNHFGGRAVARTASNIVWSSGELDPWRPSNIAPSDIPPTKTDVASIIIKDCGHHCDLFFPHPNDTPAIKDARAFEVSKIREWINEKRLSFSRINSERVKRQRHGDDIFFNFFFNTFHFKGKTKGNCLCFKK